VVDLVNVYNYPICCLTSVEIDLSSFGSSVLGISVLLCHFLITINRNEPDEEKRLKWGQWFMNHI
jgi:hypothetical protein